VLQRELTRIERQIVDQLLALDDVRGQSEDFVELLGPALHAFLGTGTHQQWGEFVLAVPRDFHEFAVA
jgi:hypothetical protein